MNEDYRATNELRWVVRPVLKCMIHDFGVDEYYAPGPAILQQKWQHPMMKQLHEWRDVPTETE
jgi:hypothetical protein